MKKIIARNLIMGAVLLCLFPGILSAQIFDEKDSSGVKGRKIIAAADTQSHNPRQMEYDVTMLIIKGNPDNPIVKKSTNYQKKYNEDLSKRLSVSLYPSQLKILSHLYKSRDDDMWIKLSSGSPKRISGKGKHGYVQNSHFTYEDMESENIDDYEYSYSGDAVLTIEGKKTDCYRVMKKKIKGDPSVYGKIEVYIRKSDLFTVRVDLWDSNNNPHKTIRMLKIVVFNTAKGTYTIAAKTGVSLIDNPETPDVDEGKNQYTIMEMKNIKIDEKAQIEESMFRKESL